MQLDPTSIVGHSIAVVGAASGVGRELATVLARRGALVTCMDLDGDVCDAVAEDLRSEGLPVIATPIDVTSEEEIVAAFQVAEIVQGPLHALVNCAGVTGKTDLLSEHVDVSDFDHAYEVNLRGAFLLSRLALPGMRERRYGRILHLTAIAGKEGDPGMVAYSATKAGLIGMVQAQGKEYADTGVTVNALAPALAELAEMIAWILSPASSFTTGFTFDLSCGRVGL